jgi:hypothetical protein
MTAGGSSVNIRGNVEFSVCVKGCYVGLEEWEGSENLKLFPNPVQFGAMRIKGLNRDCDYTIRDTRGVEILSGKLEALTPGIEVSQLLDGLYFLTIRHTSDVRHLKFIVKRE